MTRVFIDSNVFLYATGTGHPLCDPCAEILRRLATTAGLSGETSVEVLQEVVHVRVRRGGDREEAAGVARAARRAFTVHALEPDDLERALSLFSGDESLSMRDSIHAAVALNREVATIVSADHDFDRVSGLQRIDPLDREGFDTLHP